MVTDRVRSSLPRYLVVGLISLGVDVGTLAGTYQFWSFPLWLATTTGFWLSFAVNFLLNKYVAFRAPRRTARQFARYTALVAVNYLITVGIVTGAQALGVGYLAGKVTALALLTSTTYVVYRRWVFVG